MNTQLIKFRKGNTMVPAFLTFLANNASRYGTFMFWVSPATQLQIVEIRHCKENMKIDQEFIAEEASLHGAFSVWYSNVNS